MYIVGDYDGTDKLMHALRLGILKRSNGNSNEERLEVEEVDTTDAGRLVLPIERTRCIEPVQLRSKRFWRFSRATKDQLDSVRNTFLRYLLNSNPLKMVEPFESIKVDLTRVRM